MSEEQFYNDVDAILRRILWGLIVTVVLALCLGAYLYAVPAPKPRPYPNARELIGEWDAVFYRNEQASRMTLDVSGAYGIVRYCGTATTYTGSWRWDGKTNELVLVDYSNYTLPDEPPFTNTYRYPLKREGSKLMSPDLTLIRRRK